MRTRRIIGIVLVLIGLAAISMDFWAPAGWILACPGGGDPSALCSSGALCGCPVNKAALALALGGALAGIAGLAILAWDFFFAKN